MSYSTMTPNKSPEPTAVIAGSSAVAVHAASRRWLAFFVRPTPHQIKYMRTSLTLSMHI